MQVFTFAAALIIALVTALEEYGHDQTRCDSNIENDATPASALLQTVLIKVAKVNVEDASARFTSLTPAYLQGSRACVSETLQEAHLQAVQRQAVLLVTNQRIAKQLQLGDEPTEGGSGDKPTEDATKPEPGPEPEPADNEAAPGGSGDKPTAAPTKEPPRTEPPTTTQTSVVTQAPTPEPEPEPEPEPATKKPMEDQESKEEDQEKKHEEREEKEDGEDEEESFPRGGTAPPRVVTQLQEAVSAGTQVLAIVNNMGFSIGQVIVIDAGTMIEEFNKIVGFGSLILESPLKYDHVGGAAISTESATQGETASLDAAGFKSVTSLCCPSEMEQFFNRLLKKMEFDVCNMDFQYMLDVITLGNPCKYWSPQGTDCPALSPECKGKWCR